MSSAFTPRAFCRLALLLSAWFAGTGAASARVASLPFPRIALAAAAGVSSASGAFPKQDPEKAFAELKIYDVRGLPWRVPREDWDGALQRVASDPAWQAWLKKEREAVAAWRTQRRDRVEWIAGWYHDFVSPKDGSLVLFTPDIPGEQVPHFRTPSDPKVEITPKLFAAWVHAFRLRHAATLVRAARLYRLTGDEEAAAWAASQLDFYAANFTARPARQDGARLYCQSLTEATGLVRYVQAARLLWQYAAPERRTRWFRDFFEPEVAILNRSYRSIHNIACWQRSAAAQVALLYGERDLWREAVDGDFGLREQLAKGVTSDYLWCEQSLGYGRYVVRACAGLFEMAGVLGRAGELSRELAIVQNLLLAPTYLRFPSGALPNPADSTVELRAPDAEEFAAHYRLFPTPLGLIAASKRRDWDTLLDPPARSPRPADLPSVASCDLRSSRMAVLRRGPWQVFFHYGQLTASHAQQEALNFSASYEDVDLTRDAGTVPYGSALHSDYFTRAPAQNCLLVNGEGQENPNPGELLEFDPHLARMAAAQPRYQPGARATRALSIEGNRLVDKASLQVSGARSQVLGLALHLQGEVTFPSIALQPDASFARQRAAPFAYWTEPRGANFRDRAEALVRCGDRTFRLIISCPGEFRLWHARTPDRPPRLRDSLCIETLATQATFTTVFQPVQQGGVE